MTKHLRESAVPLCAGMVLHAAIYFCMMWSIPSPSSAEAVTPGSLVMHVYAWLNVAFAIVPGMAVGFLASRRPMLHGFIAIALAQFALITLAQTTWYAVPDATRVVSFVASSALSASQFGLYGLVSAAAGYLVRGGR